MPDWTATVEASERGEIAKLYRDSQVVCIATATDEEDAIEMIRDFQRQFTIQTALEFR